MTMTIKERRVSLKERGRMCDWKKNMKKGRNILRKRRTQLWFALEIGETARDRFDKWPDSPNIQMYLFS